MAFSLLYSDVDDIGLFSYVDALAERLGMQHLDVDPGGCIGALASMKREFPHTDGMDKASPFKMVAHFATHFVAASPILEGILSAEFGEISKLPNHQNAIIAYEIGADSLHGAEIIRGDGSKIILENRIHLSKHSYCDVIDALGILVPVNHFKLVSVLFEQLAYRANPDASYELVM